MAGMVVASASAHANLLTNPGFETGDFTGWTRSGNPGFTNVVNFNAHSGTYAARLGPVGSDGYLSQTVSDVAGQNLTISAFLQGGGTPNEFAILLNGTPLLTLDNVSLASYTLESATGTATGSDTITFAFRDDPNFLSFDDASVTSGTAVPEPASLALLGVGLFGISLVRRRRG